MRRPGSLFLTLFFFAATAQAHELPTGNLAALGRVWGILEHAHPWLGYRDIDWDAAAIRAIDRLQDSPNDLSGALTEMLAVLNDDATFVRRPCVESAMPAVDRSTRMLADGIVYISATSPIDRNLLKNAKAAVVDLRPQPGRCTAPALAPDVIPLLVRGNVARADLRKVKHHGYRSQDPASTGTPALGGVEGRFTTTFTTIETGIESGNGEVAKVVFIVSDRSAIPSFATALAASETAAFVSAGRFPLASTLDHCEMALPDGNLLTVRTSELVDSEGYGAEPAATMTFAADAPEADILAGALQLAKPRATRRRASHPSVSLRSPDYEWRRDATYAEMTLPDTAHRILAAYRLWNVIELFHPSPGLEWFRQFNEMITMLGAATTREQYELALAEIVARIPDGQASVSTRVLDAAPPFRLASVEDKPIVIESATTNVKPGDELLRIDGREVNERIAALARFTSASTVAAKQAAILRDLPNGVANSQSTFTFRRPDGTTYDVALTRTISSFDDPKPWRILEGNVAYVDARYLDASEVSALLDDVRNTHAMILDLRNGARALPELVQRLNATGAASASTMHVPELVGGAYQSADLDQTIGGSSQPRYGGETILLVDERTQGAAEELAMMLDTIANGDIVGTPSAGASGAMSSLVLPGNILIRFTAAETRYPDGREVLGIGVLPTHRATQTIRALAEGRDEVLEQAVAMTR